jgi:hypothetical protein
VTRRKTPPRDAVHELLAAPDTLRKSESEKVKYQQRKAQEAAAAARLLASKSKDRPTVEDMLADIVRVADDQATNPFWQHRSISRRRYELYGHYPVEYVDQEFGQWEHAKQVAGLADQPGTRLWRANRAAESRRAHAERYVERYVAPYVVRPDDHRMPDHGSYVLLSISDTHSQFLDPFVWIAFQSAIRDLRPDGVLFNGDILEGAEISRHPKIPGWTESLQSEFDFAREMIRQVRENAGHRGDIFWTGGNHDVDRLASYLTQTAPGLASLRDLRIDRQLGLDEYAVRLFTGGTIASPRGTEDARPGFLLFGHYRIHHGTRLGATPAVEELRDAGRSGQSGHVHRASQAWATNERQEAISWMTTPAGCRHEVGRAYMKGTTTGWQRGFGFARIFADGSVHQYPVVVSGDRLSVEGYTYTKNPDLLDPPTKGQWVADYGI